MRQLILLLFVFSKLVGFTQSKEEQQVRKFLKDWEAAWNSGSMGAHMSFYKKSDSTLRITNKRGLKWGWQTIYDDFKKGFPDSASMGKTFVDVESIKKLAHKYYYAVVKSGVMKGSRAQSGYLSLLLERIKRKWYIIVDH